MDTQEIEPGKAQILWLTTIGRYFLNILSLKSFYSATTNALQSSADSLRASHRQSAEEALRDPEVQKTFKARHMPDSAKMLPELSEGLAARTTRMSAQAVDSSVLVFAHSMLDGALSDCCTISFKAQPSDWYHFVNKRTIEVESLLGSNAEALIREKAAEFVKQLSRESMKKRLDCLHQVCCPKLKDSKPPTAWITANQLETFDSLRQRIIHGRYFARPVTQTSDHIAFAQNAGLHALFLVNEAYGFTEKQDIAHIYPFTFLRLCVAIRREFPELRDIFMKHINDAVSKAEL